MKLSATLTKTSSPKNPKENISENRVASAINFILDNDNVFEKNSKDIKDWNKKGYSFLFSGKNLEAISCFENALKEHPCDKFAWNYKGVALYNLGKYEEAVNCYNMRIKIDPKDTFSWKMKGDILENLGKHDEALKCYNYILEINPGDSEALFGKVIAKRSL